MKTKVLLVIDSNSVQIHNADKNILEVYQVHMDRPLKDAMIMAAKFIKENVCKQIGSEIQLPKPKRCEPTKKFPEDSPSNWDYCPHCYGSFSFKRPSEDFLCCWCSKDIRDKRA